MRGEDARDPVPGPGVEPDQVAGPPLARREVAIEVLAVLALAVVATLDISPAPKGPGLVRVSAS